MPFPAPSVTPPSLTSYQVQFNGYTFGGDTNVNLQKIEGLDRPAVRQQDPDWPRTRGQSRGLDLLSGRDITFTCEIAPVGSLTLADATQNLRNCLAPRGTTEDPLFVAFNGLVYVTSVRIRKHNVPVDISYALGNLAKNVSLQFHATDPFFYSTPTSAPSCGLGTPTGGFGFPFPSSSGFPLSFGGGTGGNSVTCTNTGDVECYPILYITGPVTYPSITNLTTGETVAFALTMATDDILVVNMDTPHSATYYVAGTYPNNGASRLYTLSTQSTWWSLPPAQGPNAVNGGVSTIQFESQDTTQVAGTLQVQYCSAFSSLT